MKMIVKAKKRTGNAEVIYKLKYSTFQIYSPKWNLFHSGLKFLIINKRKMHKNIANMEVD